MSQLNATRAALVLARRHEHRRRMWDALPGHVQQLRGVCGISRPQASFLIKELLAAGLLVSQRTGRETIIYSPAAGATLAAVLAAPVMSGRVDGVPLKAKPVRSAGSGVVAGRPYAAGLRYGLNSVTVITGRRY